MSNDRPRVKLQPGGDKRAMLGHPWNFSNELVMEGVAKALPPGTVVTLMRADGRPLGAAFFNPHSLIAARLLTRDADRAIDETFLHRRLERALKLREQLIGAPFYRLIHAEADGIPGCIIDRFGDVGAWSSLGIYRILAQLQPADLERETLHPGLLRLIEDPAHHDLVESLEAYFDRAGDMQATATYLALHRSSLYYRLSRVEEIAGVNLRSGDDRLALHLGIKMARLAGFFGNAV